MKLGAQRGIALLIMVFVLAMIAISLMLNTLNPVKIKSLKDKNTYFALTEAKAALIGWSARHITMPGSLPCTDIGNNGTATNAGSNCTAYIGRLPWRTLGIADVRDGEGECLWYALSPIYRNVIAVGNRSLANANQININVPGSITLVNFEGSANPAPDNPVIAVIIAAGRPVGAQNRAFSAGGTCGGNYIAANYLDVFNTINNATGNNVAGNNYTFIKGVDSPAFNDRIITITASDLYRPIRQRMVKEIIGNNNTMDGVADFYNVNGVYPCPAANATSAPDCSLTNGFVNDTVAGMDLGFPVLGPWLANNNWFAAANYSYTDSNNVQLTITDTVGTYSCSAAANVFNCL
jgi:hypothetical protein